MDDSVEEGDDDEALVEECSDWVAVLLSLCNWDGSAVLELTLVCVGVDEGAADATERVEGGGVAAKDPTQELVFVSSI